MTRGLSVPSNPNETYNDNKNLQVKTKLNSITQSAQGEPMSPNMTSLISNHPTEELS